MKDIFSSHDGLELKLWDPLAHIEHQRILKFQPRPLVRSKYTSCRLATHFRASSIKTVRRDVRRSKRQLLIALLFGADTLGSFGAYRAPKDGFQSFSPNH
jgi:hypothetical protein